MKPKGNVQYRADSLKNMFDNFHSDHDFQDNNSQWSNPVTPPHIHSPAEMSPSKAKEAPKISEKIMKEYGEKELMLSINTSLERRQMNNRKKKDFKEALQ